MASKEIGWNDGSGENIVLSAAEWRGDQTVHIQVGENFGPVRNANIIFYSEDTSKTAAVQVQQQDYAVESSISSLVWEDTEDDGRKIVLTTNGTSLNNFKATISGAYSDKFTLGSPVKVSSTNTETRYELPITPIGRNTSDTDYVADLNISAGLGDFISFSVQLKHKKIFVVSTAYSDFRGIFTVVPASGIIPARGTNLTLKLNSVLTVKRDTMSDGSVRTEYNFPYPNFSTTTWYANIVFGVPSRASFNSLRSSQSGGEVSFSLAIQSLGMTLYSNANSSYSISIWPSGQSAADSTEYNYTWGGTIQDNAVVSSSYGDIEILNSPGWTISNGVAVIGSGEQNFVVNLACQRKTTWTSGAERTEDVQVFGDGSESGIQDENIPETGPASTGEPPITGWTTGALTWPVAFNGRNTTQLTLKVDSNVYYTRTFVGKWKTDPSKDTPPQPSETPDVDMVKFTIASELKSGVSIKRVSLTGDAVYPTLTTAPFEYDVQKGTDVSQLTVYVANDTNASVTVRLGYKDFDIYSQLNLSAAMSANIMFDFNEQGLGGTIGMDATIQIWTV